jgi:signal transduction histidine kinase
VRRRIVQSTVLIAVAAVIVLGVPLGILAAHRVRADANARLEREADAVAAAVDDRLEAHRALDVRRLGVLVAGGHRVTIVPARGPRIFVGRAIPGRTTAVAAGATGKVRVVAEAPASEVAHRVRDGWLLVAALGLAGIAAAALLGFVLGRWLARPFERLAVTSRRLGDGDFSARAGHFAIPEADAVATALDAAAVRIAGLVGREREFSANVSHQLRTPLTALRLRLEELESISDPELVGAEAQRALAEADRLQETIADLLAAARDGRAGQARPIPLGALANEHVAAWRPVFERRRRRLSADVRDAPVAQASPGAVGQALDVLLENALEHGSGAVTVTVGAADGGALVTVADEGAGIPEEAEQAIFERGSSLAGGSGVGLHLARALVEADGGRIVLASRAPTRFEIRLRAAGTTRSAARATGAVGAAGTLPNL